MSTAVGDSRFLLAIRVPPLTVAVCALALLARAPAGRRSGAPIRSAPLMP
jgi:hypothetical protein